MQDISDIHLNMHQGMQTEDLRQKEDQQSDRSDIQMTCSVGGRIKSNSNFLTYKNITNNFITYKNTTKFIYNWQFYNQKLRNYLNKRKEYKISQMNKYKIILIKILNVK